MRIYFLLAALVGGLLILQTTSCDPTRRLDAQELSATPVSTFILVRHAEKDFGDKPNLTEEGRQRAAKLSMMLERVDLDAVYSTNTKRTLQTAEPVADYHDLKIQGYSAFELNQLAARLRNKHRGETVLVVGHSNTTPALASILDKANEYPRFSELDYTNYYVVTIPPRGATRVLKMRF